MPTEEMERLVEEAGWEKNWKRWGTYLSERQWGTVREDYSPGGDAWNDFPHDHARSRAYRWGEDGLLGWTDRQCRLCFAVALWNGEDPILKERLFGLTGPEGNHAEDVKECYYYLDATPTQSYAKGLYKYPQREFPYNELVKKNAALGRDTPEFELADTGIFDESRYFDVTVEYAKADPNDTYIRVTIANRGPDSATVHALPTIWYRNTWSWLCKYEDGVSRPLIREADEQRMVCEHEKLREFEFLAEAVPDRWLFTENETNHARLYGHPRGPRGAKDAFHDFVIHGDESAVNPDHTGTKVAALHRIEIAAGAEVQLQFQLRAARGGSSWFDCKRCNETFDSRKRDAEAFYAEVLPSKVSANHLLIARQAYAGLIWTRQFYHYLVSDWLDGDSKTPRPAEERLNGRNTQWRHLYAREVLSMPDKWEYPWFAAWDLAFHMIPYARIDPFFAKQQLTVILREWYMHPNGQIPAYEWALGDVNPPVHAWAVWRVYKISGARGFRDRAFLESSFQKLLLNFTWWVNRKDAEGDNLFSGGFLGLDNIGVFDRSKPLPGGGQLAQADGTAWMGFYCVTMLAMALELAKENPVYQDMASKFFEHFIGISDAMNHFDGTGLWDEVDGFYYDHLRVNGDTVTLKTRSMVGLIPLLAVTILEDDVVKLLPGFSRRTEWFVKNRPDLAERISWLDHLGNEKEALLALPTRERLQRILTRMLDEKEFLAPHGIRSLSAAHGDNPFILNAGGQEHCVSYVPAESTSAMFGGNSNWRGPIWFPINYVIIEALEKFHRFYGDSFQVEFPTGSGNMLDLRGVARELSARLVSIFEPDANGIRPSNGPDRRYASDPHWKDLVLFHEYFHGDNGLGLGASHQTGWTALVVRCIEDLAHAADHDA